MSDVTTNNDWFEDDEVSFEGALARFEELQPQPTTGPVPGGGCLLSVASNRGGTTQDLTSSRYMQVVRSAGV